VAPRLSLRAVRQKSVGGVSTTYSAAQPADIQADELLEAYCGTARIMLHVQITPAATAELKRSDPAAPLLEVY